MQKYANAKFVMLNCLQTNVSVIFIYIVTLSGTLECSPQFDCGRLLVRVWSHPVRGVVTWGLLQFVLCTLVNQSLSLSHLYSLIHHTPLLSFSVHFSVKFCLRTWQRCSWLWGGTWRSTEPGWTLMTSGSDSSGLGIPSFIQHGTQTPALLWKNK